MTDTSKMHRVVAFGGGTGMPNLLKGLKHHDIDLTAVVVVSDDGGSSGELRTLYDMPAPGDVRNVIASLSENHEELANLVQHRFDDRLLDGHSLGNLMLAALTRIKGSFQKAVETLSELLGVKARVIPSTFQKLALVAVHPDGSKSTGEENLSRSGKPIQSLSCRPEPLPLEDSLKTVLESADVMIFGPGSLYTSIIPHLLIPGLKETVNASPARKIYIANIMTQPGETNDYSLADHVEALKRHGLESIDAVIQHEGEIEAQLLEQYAQAGSVPVGGDLEDGSPIVWKTNLLENDAKTLKHDASRLAGFLMDSLNKNEDVADAQAQVVIQNDNGLHTRPASQIVKAAGGFDATITLRHRDLEADANSIMDLILLTATKGSTIDIAARGPQAEEAVATLVGLVNNRFQEEN